jgi:hypothetical protein
MLMVLLVVLVAEGECGGPLVALVRQIRVMQVGILIPLGLAVALVAVVPLLPHRLYW